MKNLVLFGATGGLGGKLKETLAKKYNVISLGSKDVNITDKSSVDNFFNSNDVDIVINMAAYNYDCLIHKYDLNKIELASKQIEVNINGNVNILSSCLPKMRQKKYGRVIAASSVLADKPIIGTSIYSASKSFIETLYKTAALENINSNITCNTIQLGYFDGGLVYKIQEDVRQKIVDSIPAKRLGTIEELQNTIQYLIDTPYINGSTIKINGGLN